MKKYLLSILFFTLFLPTLAMADKYPVVKVVDGDTIDVIYEGKEERVRMLNVDTPESVHPQAYRNTPAGKKASDYTKKRLAGKKVDLEFQGRKRGKFKRLLAYVIVDGENFSLELIRVGHSYYYTKYGKSEKHHTQFLAAEKQAKAQRLNIWSDPGAYPKKPTVKSSDYHGNVSSHKFHRPGCRYYNCSKCTRVFKSRDEAISAGYVPCGVCKP